MFQKSDKSAAEWEADLSSGPLKEEEEEEEDQTECGEGGSHWTQSFTWLKVRCTFLLKIQLF